MGVRSSCICSKFFVYFSALSSFQDVDGIGAAGAIAKVNHGYARNYLVPNKLAAVRRGKQSGSVADIQVESTSPSAAAMTTRGGSLPSTGLTDEEREKFLAAQQRRRLESAVKKLTTQTLVSYFYSLSMRSISFFF